MATTDAVCGETFSWMDNSLSQSPCFVTAALGAVCETNNAYNIPALPPGETYLGPNAANPPNPCLCSTVYYSMLAACSACQLHTAISWSNYSINCTAAHVQISISTFPLDLPQGVPVPDYGYQNVTATNGIFNVTAAEADHGPESSAPPQSTATSSVVVVSTGPTSSIGPVSTGPASSTTKSKSNTGAIAGGVVGGIAGVILVASLIYWFFIRRRRSRAPSPALVGLTSGRDPMSPFPMSYAGTSPSNFSAIQTPKLYDPSDPSTFPSSPATSAMYTTHTYPEIRNQYNGAPEI